MFSLGHNFKVSQISKKEQICKRQKLNVVCSAGKQAVDVYKLKMTDNILKHPDAIQRRKTYKRRRSQQPELQNNNQAKWWQIDDVSNIFIVSTPVQFQEMVSFAQQHGNLVVVNFFTPSCNACKTITPKFNQITAQNPDIIFVKFNAQHENMRLQAQEFGIPKLPFFHIYFEGKCLSSFAANLISINRLRKQINACKMIMEGKKALISSHLQ